MAFRLYIVQVGTISLILFYRKQRLPVTLYKLPSDRYSPSIPIDYERISGTTARIQISKIFWQIEKTGIKNHIKVIVRLWYHL